VFFCIRWAPIFARIFRDSSQIFRDFVQIFRILPGFSTNQNFWRCACTTWTPASYTAACCDVMTKLVQVTILSSILLRCSGLSSVLERCRHASTYWQLGKCSCIHRRRLSVSRSSAWLTKSCCSSLMVFVAATHSFGSSSSYVSYNAFTPTRNALEFSMRRSNKEHASTWKSTRIYTWGGLHKGVLNGANKFTSMKHKHEGYRHKWRHHDFYNIVLRWLSGTPIYKMHGGSGRLQRAKDKGHLGCRPP